MDVVLGDARRQRQRRKGVILAGWYLHGDGMCRGGSRLADHAVLEGGSHTMRKEVEKRGSAAIRYPWTHPQQRVRPAHGGRLDGRCSQCHGTV